ncbi:MAG: hypothetical protein DMF95_19895 [Acidobacteria bacterium]|nr:MAG: hypothetical protein DMF95_19895 [Acidobacteriota bacterium]
MLKRVSAFASPLILRIRDQTTKRTKFTKCTKKIILLHVGRGGVGQRGQVGRVGHVGQVGRVGQVGSGWSVENGTCLTHATYATHQIYPPKKKGPGMRAQPLINAADDAIP